ncbi:flagellar hook-length control protein FliK [Oscillospiraceae bacterium LTW-04]|nr:flagellar hook-length control protein FliK [Oscillospiraceae bacterium MB24-C1]
MNNVTVQTPQVATQLTGSQSVLQKALAGLNANGLGNNSASFLELLTAVLDTGGEAALAAQLKKDAETLGAQMNAEMLTINPLLTMMLAGQTTQTNSGALQQSPTLDSFSQLQSLASAAHFPLSPELLSQLQQAIDTAGKPVSVSTSSSTVFAAALQTIKSEGEATAPVLLNSASDEASALQGQSQFERAVTLAQQLLKSAGQPTAETTEIDLEDLQKKVDSGAFLPQLTNTVNTSTTVDATQVHKALDAQDLFSQIKTSVTQHAQQGATDFTIKLSPEGLGEITVKLLEDGGKTTLSLTASDANVQRLLGSELNNLRDIMRPYNVEVAQVVQTNEPQNMNMQQQFSQQFSQHSYTGQQQTPSFAYDPNYGESALSGDPTPPVILPDSVLDAYI